MVPDAFRFCVSFFRRCSWFAYRVACSRKSRFLEFRKQRLFFGFHYGAAPPMKSTEKNHYFQTEIDLPASRVSTCLFALDEIIFKKQKNQIKRVNCNVVHETDDGSRAAGKTWKTGGTRYTVSSWRINFVRTARYNFNTFIRTNAYYTDVNNDVYRMPRACACYNRLPRFEFTCGREIGQTCGGDAANGGRSALNDTSPAAILKKKTF